MAFFFASTAASRMRGSQLRRLCQRSQLLRLFSTDENVEKIIIRMPEIGGGGKVIKWYKDPGDLVKFDDMLCDIETNKFTFGMATEDEGECTMGEILVRINEECDDGQEICYILQKQQAESDTNNNENPEEKGEEKSEEKSEENEQKKE